MITGESVDAECKNNINKKRMRMMFRGRMCVCVR